MKKNLYLILIALTGLMCVLSSCEDDEKKLLKPEITEGENLNVKIGNTLEITPEIDDPEKYLFQWFVNDKPVSEEKKLSFSKEEKGEYVIKLVATYGDAKKIITYTVNVRGKYYNSTFIVTEGNLQDNGSISVIDEEGNFIPQAYLKENGKAPGSILQDIYVCNDKIYMVCQNGDDNGGEGFFIIADAETLKKERVINTGGIEDDNIWPQHIVVVSDEKAYVQYATSDMETHSGLKALNLTTGILSSEDIEGTYGEFAAAGASKMRMLLEEKKLFVPCGNSLKVINTDNDKVVKTIPFEGLIKDVVKGKDGNLWLAVTGNYDPKGNEIQMYGTSEVMYEATYSSCPKIIGVNPDTYDIVATHTLERNVTTPLLGQFEMYGMLAEYMGIYFEFDFTVNPAYPSIGMCASKTKDVLYFNLAITQTGENYNTFKFDYKTGELTSVAYAPDMRIGNFYGYSGASKNGIIYLGLTNSRGKWSKIVPFDETTGERIDITDKEYDFDENGQTDNYYYVPSGFPSGIDFSYRFN